jgi:hypothetical protein
MIASQNFMQKYVSQFHDTKRGATCMPRANFYGDAEHTNQLFLIISPATQNDTRLATSCLIKRLVN